MMLRRVLTPALVSLCAASLLVPSASSASSFPLTSLAIPLPTAGPSWFDLHYFNQVIASGTRGVRIPTAAGIPPTIGLASPGIRPGQWLVTVIADPNKGVGFAWCTANFVFRKSATLAIGTAGHCAAKDALGGFKDVTAYVVPPNAAGAPGFYHIGKFVLSHNNGVGDDFALVQIYPQYKSWVIPTMPVWGGPIGAYKGNATQVVEWFGHAAGFGTGGTPRAGVAQVWTAARGNAFAWVGPSMEGDSGSGVITSSGAAAGDLTHIVVNSGGVYGQPYPAMMAGTRISRMLQIARGWTLVNGSALPTQ